MASFVNIVEGAYTFLGFRAFQIFDCDVLHALGFDPTMASSGEVAPKNRTGAKTTDHTFMSKKVDFQI
jgi:hypothetical protein